MDLQLLFCANLVLCAIVFLELLFTFRKNSLLKVCLLLIIASLFAMNYYAWMGVTTRFHFMVSRSMRLIYVCSTMLAIVYLVSPKIPKWVIWLLVVSVTVVTSLRIFYYDQIDIETMSQLPNQVFSVGAEFYSPKLFIRYTIFGLAIVATIIAFYYYRQFLITINWESPHYKQLLWWIISLVVPFFLLTIFGMLGSLGIFNLRFSAVLFSLFSCIIILSILLRPRFLNKRSYLEVYGFGMPKI
jgi:hypothetical protein